MRADPARSILVTLAAIAGLVGNGSILVLGILAVRWVVRKRNREMIAILRNWADEHRYELLQYERRRLVTPWFSNGHCQVFYVRLFDEAGRIRRAWVRCGGYYLGSVTRRVEVRWEDQRGPLTFPPSDPTSRDPSEDPLWDPWIDE